MFQNLTKSKSFLITLLACVFGILCASFASIDFIFLYIAALLCLVGMIIFYALQYYRRLFMWLLFFCIGMARMLLAQPDFLGQSFIGFYNGQDVDVVGVVRQEPDVRLDHQKLTLGVHSISAGSGKENSPPPRGGARGGDENHLLQITTPSPSSERRGEVHGNILIKTPLYPAYQYGDIIRLNCAIERPEQIEDFAYDAYLARYNIYSVCWRGTLETIGHNAGNPIMAAIFTVKKKFLNAINASLAEPHASFLAGILIGARRGIPQYILDAFSATGTTHIIAISGSNITIIGAVIIGFIQLLGVAPKRAFWIISACIIAFVIMTGASASVVRAGVMGIFVLLAKRLGRASRATNALVFTAFVMCMVNPHILVFDAGFQLSFLATMGLVYINPLLLPFTKKLPSLFGMTEALVTTISAMITTTPLILYQFGRLSIVAPLANVLILPAIPPAMAIGFISGLLGMLWQPLGTVSAWGAWLLLHYMIRVAEILAHAPFASVMLGNFHWSIMVAMYVLIMWGARWVGRRQKIIVVRKNI